MVDLVRFWEDKQHEFPLLVRVAMDVLPIQASAVPCERVFSSSKATCTLSRSRIRPELLEALQVLKFSFKQDRLTFVDGLLAKEEDYTISGPVTAAAEKELRASGGLVELADLLANAEEPRDDFVPVGAGSA